MDKKDKKKKHEPASVEDSGEAKEKIEQLENQVKRTLADYQNLEKRMQEQKREWIRSANRDLLLNLLPILDTLVLAKKHEKNETVQILFQQFIDVLQKEGLEKIKTVGQDFNPQTMECIKTELVNDEQDGKVLEETREGFVLYDKVLRPAQVVVGQRKFKVTNIPSGIE